MLDTYEQVQARAMVTVTKNRMLVDRMPDGRSAGYPGTQSAGEVHHPHRGAQVQYQVPDRSGKHAAHVLQVRNYLIFHCT